MRPPLAVVPVRDDTALASRGRVNFAAALPDVLERLGFGSWDSCTLRELDGEALEGRPLVVVAYAPEPLWSMPVIAALNDFAGPALIEGPLPESAALRLFGIVTDGEIGQYHGRLEREPGSESDELARTSPGERAVELSSLWARSQVEQGTVPRDELGVDLVGSVALSYVDDAVARLEAPQTFYRQPRPTLGAATLLVQASTLLGDGDPAVSTFAPWSFRKTMGLLDLIGGAMEADQPGLDHIFTAGLIAGRQDGGRTEEVDLEPIAPFMTELLEFLLGAAGYAAGRFPEDVESYRTLAASLRGLVLPIDDEPDEVVWAAAGLDEGTRQFRGRNVTRLPVRRLASVCMWAELAGIDLDVLPLVESGDPAEKVWPETLRVRDMARVSRYSGASGPAVAEALSALVERIEAADPSEAPLVFGPAAEAAAIVGDRALLRRIMERAVTERRENGLLRSADPWLGASFLSAARRLIAAVPGCSDELVERWRRGLGPLQRWIPIDEESAAVLVRATGDGDDPEGLPFLVRDGSRIGISFPLLSWLVAECAPPPLTAPASYAVAPAADAWTLATAVLESACTSAGLPRRIVWPWPAVVGATVVHDMTRMPPREKLEASLAWEARGRRASTYCFSPAAAETPMRGLLEELGHETALSERDGARLAEAHFRGPRGWLEAEAAGLPYVLLPWKHSGGHPLPLVTVDGRLGAARVLELQGFDPGGRAEVAGAPDRRDHLALAPSAAEAAAPELREDVWWTTLADVAARTRRTTGVRAWLEEGMLVLLSDDDVPAFQLLLGEREGYVPCLLLAGSPLGRLASGRRPGAFALDLEAGRPVHVGWRQAKGGKRELATLEPTPVEPRHRPAGILEIRARLEEAKVASPPKAGR